jgi:methylated-DNA-protein-cysteine methyltransferase-like protein
MISKQTARKSPAESPGRKVVKKAAAKPRSELYRKIYAVVRKIPMGKVASYGQVARVAGLERHARVVGYALHSLKNGNPEKVPWQRVINAKGYISLKDFDGGAIIQRKLLESEGIEFGPNDKVDWNRFGWKK